VDRLRLPLPRLMYDSFVSYPVPRNLNYWYTFGGILMVMLVVADLTGVVLAMHYAPMRSGLPLGRASCVT
jgi:ubiquinol-cytochrome c reductase cytochrome b subunit